MNIIYKLENISKQTEPRIYIGSKTNCYVKNNIIYNEKTNIPYYGSSTNLIMKEDLQKGDIFKATIFKIVEDKNNIIDIENSFIKSLNAVENKLYYNLAYANLNYNYDKTTIANKYGETILEIRDSKIHYNKRRTSCRNIGFNNVSNLILKIYELKNQNKTYSDIVNLYGKNRHFYERIYRTYDVQTFINEINSLQNKEDLVLNIRKLYNENLSYELISKQLNINFLTFDYLFDNWDLENKKFSCTNELLTLNEIKKEIYNKVNEGRSLRNIANDYNLSSSSVTRYYNDYINNNLSLNET